MDWKNHGDSGAISQGLGELSRDRDNLSHDLSISVIAILSAAMEVLAVGVDDQFVVFDSAASREVSPVAR
jgi:hypothetical protein